MHVASVWYIYPQTGILSWSFSPFVLVTILVPMSSNNAILEGLNEAQHQAVTSLEGALLVLAGAGSGKTRVLTSRIAWAIHCGFVRAEEVFAVTFTNKAAASMRERVSRLAGQDFSRLWVRTFHSACSIILRTEHEAAGIPRDYTIFDQDDQTALLRRIIRERDLPLDTKLAAQWLKAIHRAKDSLISPAEYQPASRDPRQDEALQTLYTLYNQGLRANGALDFGDLIFETVRLFRGNDHIASRYANRFGFVLVDEFQDTNAAQYELLRLLAGGHNNACIVGDDDQSIYSWRGARVDNFAAFTRDFVDVQSIRLEQNYRSTPQILRVAARVIEKNDERMKKTVWSALPDGEKPRVVSFPRDRDEAGWIATRLAKLIQDGCAPEDCAIFYRANWQSRIFEEALLACSMPYQLVGSMRFYERREIRDLMAWLRLAVNPRDGSAFARAIQSPPRGVGEKSIASLVAYAEEHGLPVVDVCAQQATSLVRGKAKQDALVRLARTIREFDSSADPLSARVSRLARESGLFELYAEEEERVENIQEFINSISAWEESSPEGTAADFLAEVSLLGQTDETSGNGKGVFLMTVHNAKGLEFGTVFATGLEEGIFPHYLSVEEPARLQEERRLFYVAATRAKERLYLCHASARYSFGREMHNDPSRFLDEFPVELADWEEVSPKREESHWRERNPYLADSSPKKSGTASRCVFAQGQHVLHREYGPGVILERSGEGKLVRLRVAFADRVCTLIELYSNLEPLDDARTDRGRD